MQTVADFLRRVTDAGFPPHQGFSVPPGLRAERALGHAEYREANYEHAVKRIAEQAYCMPTRHQPAAVASLVLEYVTAPGAWVDVADFCRSWGAVPFEGAENPTLVEIHAGMTADALRRLDGNHGADRFDRAMRVIASAVPGSIEITLPCHPKEHVTVQTRGGRVSPDAEAHCPDCGRGFPLGAAAKGVAV